MVGTLPGSGPFVRADECSTPFGITVVGTGTTAAKGLTDQGAQRLSASLWSARSVAALPASLCYCAQRLSASLWSAPGVWIAPRPAAYEVLNAFRHHCGRHAVPAAGSGPSRRCAQRLSASLWSARQMLGSDRYQAACSAQRLSASLWSAPGGVVVPGVPQCSTPFGVTVVGTDTGTDAHAGAQPTSAQRLSASLWSAPRPGRAESP